MVLYTAQRKRQQRLISVLVGVFVVTLAVLYFGFFRGESGGGGGPSFPGTLYVKEILENIKKIDFDSGVLKNERFLELRPYETLPRDIETGKDNPFSN